MIIIGLIIIINNNNNNNIIIKQILGTTWTRKKSESQMGFEPTTLRDLVGCSNH